MIEQFAVIIGAMKCGTTTLYRWLCEHPEIAECKLNEPNFFVSAEMHQKGPTKYESLWEFDRSRHQIALEASTSYTKIPSRANAAKRMAEFGRQFKLIYLMRDPVDQIESHLTHGLADHWFDNEHPFENCPVIFDAVRYARQLDEYYQRFPTEDILLLDFEDLRSRPLEVYERVLTFLGVELGPKPDFTRVYNQSAGKYRDNLVWHQLRKIPILYDAAVRVVPQVVRDRLRALISPRVDRITLDDNQRRRIANTIWKDLQRLETEYKFSTNAWNYSATRCQTLANQTG